MRWILALHVISVISWMAGILYIWRLYVYHSLATDESTISTLQVMERRLLNAITTPAMVSSLVTGLLLIGSNPQYYLNQPWMHLKLTLLAFLFLCHGLAVSYRKKLLQNSKVKSDKFYRVMNEIPTLLMIGIVIAVIVKPFSR